MLPSWIKPYTADAYNYAYSHLYCELWDGQVREVVDKIKANQEIGLPDSNFAVRHAKEFFKQVEHVATLEISLEDLKALERKEKVAGIHPSQHKNSQAPSVKKKKEDAPSPSGENPS